MKNLILIIAVLVVSACATTSTMKSVAGTYEVKRGEDTIRMVFLENGIAWPYKNGKKIELEAKWKIIDGAIHAEDKNGTGVYRINKDGSLTAIAEIDKNGNRTDAPKEILSVIIKKIK